MASRNKRPTISAAVRAPFLALALAAIPQFALAQPPSAGATHTFRDPIFNGTVFCDTLDAVRAIATAEAPDETYANYYLTTNLRDEPICMAIAPTGVVVEVIPIGIMLKGGQRYQAWAVETDVGGVTAFALYLEPAQYVNA